MFPWVYGFHWTAFHVTFLGVFFTLAAIIGTTVGKALLRTVRDFKTHRSEGIMWESAFKDLPRLAKACRHAMTEEMHGRICPNGFDCRQCVTHAGFLTANPLAPSAALLANGMERISGFELPLDRYYHRGHTWAKPESDGTFTVGFDGLGVRLAGPPEKVDLPPVGTSVEVNGKAWEFTRNARRVRILSPISGEVVEHGGPDQEWYLRIRPESSDVRHLLRGREVRLWMMQEIDRMQRLISPVGVGETLADGGALVNDIPGMLKTDIDLVWDEMFLEP